MLKNLNNKNVLVIGGSSGIGFATAQMAHEAGAKVTLAARDALRLAEAADRIGGVLATREVDLRDDASVAALFDQAAPFDHVIVTASQVKIAPVRDLPLEDAFASFDSKFWGFYRVARHAAICEGGSLSVVSGYLANRPVAGRSLMVAINAALEGLTRGLALELAPVRVNALSPAMVQTEMWNGLSEADRQALFAKTAESYPAGVIGRPEDVAAQILLLAASPYATGTVVMLDGGASLI